MAIEAGAIDGKLISQRIDECLCNHFGSYFFVTPSYSEKKEKKRRK
jgi:hypothetical protein